MLKITELTEVEMTEFAESFAWYEYANGSVLYDLVRPEKSARGGN